MRRRGGDEGEVVGTRTFCPSCEMLHEGERDSLHSEDSCRLYEICGSHGNHLLWQSHLICARLLYFSSASAAFRTSCLDTKQWLP